MANQERDFKGVWIPKIVWLDDRLNALEKVILTEIDSLDQGERGCWASNKHIAEFCQCSESKVSKAISKLMKIGYLRMQSFDGRQREMRSCLSNFENLPSKKCEADYQKMIESNTESDTENNTSKHKKVSKAESYESIIDAYTDDQDVKSTLFEFIKMRQRNKKPMTNYALTLMLKKLDKMAASTGAKIDILNQSIVNGWQDVYPLKKQDQRQRANDDRFYKKNPEEKIGASFNFDFE